MRRQARQDKHRVCNLLQQLTDSREQLRLYNFPDGTYDPERRAHGKIMRSGFHRLSEKLQRILSDLDSISLLA